MTRRRFAKEPELDDLEDFGELEIAEYIVFLLALDTYMRYVEEHHGDDAEDDLIRKGVTLIRLADRQHVDAIRGFLEGQLPSEVHKRMLTRAFVTLPTTAGLGTRTEKLRTLLNKGGATTMRAIFKSNKALKQARDAMAAADFDDADAALDKFAVIPMRNQRLRNWIDTAAEQAGAGTFQNAIQAASSNASPVLEELMTEKLKLKAAPAGSEEAAEADSKQADSLTSVQNMATEAAQRAMLVSGEADEPPSKSEVIGIATAAVAAAMSDPDHQANIPSALRGQLADDPEQLRAAMTGGRVLVAAGAGSGKTTTLIGRMAYLVQDLKVNPSRIFAVTFNREAAHGISEKIAQKIGKDSADQMSIGTMHATFRKLVMDFGTPEEKAALSQNMMGKRKSATKGRVLSNRLLNIVMSDIWGDCFQTAPPRNPGMVVQSWIMNNVTPDQAKEQAIDDTEKDIATWYEWTQGFKGITKGWKPPCVESNPEARKLWTGFLAEFRDGGRDRIGDFSDMIVIARDVLKRNPKARKAIQNQYDHICVDEAQDLNEVQHEIVKYMSEHVDCDDKERSVWMVGDEIQSINRFAGARPDLFTQYHDDGCYKTRMIGTNYRCLPEIIETANELMKNHPRGIPMTTRPDPRKPRGKASIVLSVPVDHTAGAVEVIGDIKQQIDAGAPFKDFAVLSRTRLELNDYETACIIEGIPYGRKNGTSFLKAPETMAVLGYMDLVVGADFDKMQASLAAVLDKPVRLFLPAGRAEQVVQEVVNKRARRLGISSKQVNPLDLFDRQGIFDFIDAAGVQRWNQDRAVETLTELGETLQGLRRTVETGTISDRETGELTTYTTKHLIDEILSIRGAPDKEGNQQQLISVLMPLSGGGDEVGGDDPDADLNDQKPVGNVAFLYKIAQSSGAPETDPSNPLKFKARLDDLAAKAQDLRIDLDAWRAAQKDLPPEKRQDPPCVVLSTVHSVKGAQWKNTTVIMAKGTFPREPKPITEAEAETMTDEQKAKREEKERMEFLTDRQLAYVAMTRAAESLTIVSPLKNAYGHGGGKGSPFIYEAGLRTGQNVPGKSAGEPDAVDAVRTASVIRRSIFAYYDEKAGPVVSDEWDVGGYDWRGM